jgi:heptosyltransferase II
VDANCLSILFMVEFEKAVDSYVGHLLCVSLGSLSMLWRKLIPSPLPHPPKKILVTRLWAMGETLLVLPMIAELKKKYPDAQIDVLTTPRVSPLFTHVVSVDNVLLWGPRCLSLVHSYDLVIDTEPFLRISALSSWFLGKHVIGFSGSVRSSLYHTAVEFNDEQHEVLTFMDLLAPLGVYVVPTSLVKIASTTAEKDAVSILVGKLPRPYIGICSTAAESASTLRRWPPGSFAEAAKRLVSSTKGTVFFIGTKSERVYVQNIVSSCASSHIINLAGETTFGQLTAFIEQCDVFVSNDTGPMHLGAAQSVPTLGLFGPNLPVRFAPYGKGNLSLYEKQSCSPCINVHKGEIDTFSCKNNVCMRAISVESVVSAVLILLKNASVKSARKSVNTKSKKKRKK